MFEKIINSLKNAKSIDLFRFLKYTFLELGINIFFKKKIDDKITTELIKCGCCRIENFLSKEICDEIIYEIDNFIEKDKKYKTDKIDLKNGFDNRIFSFHKISNNAKNFLGNQKINLIIDNYLHKNFNYSFTLAQKVEFTENNPGSGGGWHRDNTILKYPKAMIYLSDVDDSNGYFEYIKGSHDIKGIIKLLYNKNIKPSQGTFSEKEIDNKFNNEYNFKREKFFGKAGTLIIFDGRGIHRGTPLQLGKKRYSLTNYYYYKEGGKTQKHI